MFPFPFTEMTPRGLAHEPVPDQLISHLDHLDRNRDAFGFHAAGDIHDISSQVVGELVGPDDPSDKRTRVDPNPQRDVMAIEPGGFGLVADT